MLLTGLDGTPMPSFSDVIGLDTAREREDRGGGNGTAIYAFSPLLGTFAHIPSKQANQELLVNADIEHDADGDGYGDETQDLCPGDPTRHTTCLANLVDVGDAEPGAADRRRPLTFTVKVAEPGAEHRAGRATSPSTSRSPQRRCRSGRARLCGGCVTPVVCHLVDRRRRRPGTVVLTVRPSSSDARA